jgi:hypothetical protein
MGSLLCTRRKSLCLFQLSWNGMIKRWTVCSQESLKPCGLSGFNRSFNLGVGDGCDSCLVPRDQWTNPEKIEEGFVMDRTLVNFTYFLCISKLTFLSFSRKCEVHLGKPHKN